MALYLDPTHLCLRGWYSSLGGKSVYIYYAVEAQPILYSSNRCDASWGLSVFLAAKCQTIMLSNKWSKKHALYYGVLGGNVTRRGRVSVCRGWFAKPRHGLEPLLWLLKHAFPLWFQLLKFAGTVHLKYYWLLLNWQEGCSKPFHVYSCKPLISAKIIDVVNAESQPTLIFKMLER